jgi:hypothetical protein
MKILYLLISLFFFSNLYSQNEELSQEKQDSLIKDIRYKYAKINSELSRYQYKHFEINYDPSNDSSLDGFGDGWLIPNSLETRDTFRLNQELRLIRINKNLDYKALSIEERVIKEFYLWNTELIFFYLSSIRKCVSYNPQAAMYLGDVFSYIHEKRVYIYNRKPFRCLIKDADSKNKIDVDSLQRFTPNKTTSLNETNYFEIWEYIKR